MTPAVVRERDDPRIADYLAVREAELLARRGLFVAESRIVVERLLASQRFAVRSLLLSETALAALTPALAAIPGEPLVFVAPRELISSLAGYPVHQGCLALAERGPATAPEALVAEAGAGLLVALEQLGDPDNVGGVFRNARAFGADGVLLAPGGADPLYRKAIRVSMGAALRVPFARDEAWPASLDALRRAGFTVIGLTPGAGAIAIDHAAVDLPPARRVALVLGSEGDGLSARALRQCDTLVRIPMAPGVDSLNASAASAVALHRLAVPLE
ncbi:MAG TPA: RNA methyltransferase [Phycisphaerales bacterium]|nr:RNA methyltransferase [Phycisphaerales bacterium]